MVTVVGCYVMRQPTMTLVCIQQLAPLEMNTEILIPETTGLKKKTRATSDKTLGQLGTPQDANKVS